MYLAAAALYLTADKQTVVPEGDPHARYLLVAAGGTLDDATAAKYGLSTNEPEPAGKAMQFPPANKQIAGPPRIKGGRRRGT